MSSKRVKEKAIRNNRITSSENKGKILDVINSLVKIGTQKQFYELELKENCIEWIIDVLNSFPSFDEKLVRYLLNDFTGSMQTRMREEEKYAIAIVSDGDLLLCHSDVGEKTITPDWSVIERMLDSDNVKRFILFRKRNDSIDVVYWERYRSESFVGWLGLPESEAFYYLGGENRFYTEIDGMRCVIELSDNEVEDRLVNLIDKNTIVLPQNIRRLPLIQIRSGKKRYSTLEEFREDLTNRKYNLTSFIEKYEKVMSSLEPLINRFIDDNNRVIKIENSHEKIIIRKINPHFVILFSNDQITMKNSFLEELHTKFLNNTHTRLFHAGMKISQKPLRIKSFEFFNKLATSTIIKTFIEKYERLKIIDEYIDKILCYTAVSLLEAENRVAPIHHFLNRFLEKLVIDYIPTSIILQREDKVIEFKSRDFFTGRDREIIEKVAEDLKSKIKTSEFKIYIIGVDEQTQKLEPLNSNRFKSERLNNIEAELKSIKDFSNLELRLIKMPVKEEECILIMIVKLDKSKHVDQVNHRNLNY